MRIRSAGISDVGLKREGNEDSYCVEDSLSLYVVADGMGGHQAGEVASQVAVEMITKSFRRWAEKSTPESGLYGLPDSSLGQMGNYILSSIRLANRVVYEMATEYDQYHGMGTTVAILLATPTLLVAANAGDSRIYLMREGGVERLSKDHTIVNEQVQMGMMTQEEAETSPLKHILTKNLGAAENVDPDVFEIEPRNDDRFILCSDGLTDLVKDEEILQMAEQDSDPQTLCQNLVNKALKRGGHDNTTVVSVFLEDMARPKEGAVKKIGLLVADILTGLQKAIKKLKP